MNTATFKNRKTEQSSLNDMHDVFNNLSVFIRFASFDNFGTKNQAYCEKRRQQNSLKKSSLKQVIGNECRLVEQLRNVKTVNI